MVKVHKNKSNPTRVYVYGAYPSLENAQRIDEIFYCAHQLRNDLIRVELDYQQERDEIVRKHSQVIRDLEAKYQSLIEKIEQLEADVNAESIKKRERQLSPELRDLRKQFRETKYALIKERRLEERRLREYYSTFTNIRIEELQQQKQEAKSPATKGRLNKLIRVERAAAWIAAGVHADIMLAEYAAEDRKASLDISCGLLWPTKNTVKASVKQAVKAGPRLRRYDGSGIIGGQPSIKGVSVVEALEATSNWLRITGPHEDCTRGHRNRLNTAWIRIDSDKRKPVWAAIPFVMHRDLPSNTHITNVYLVRKRVAGKFKYTVQFVLAAQSWEKNDLATNGTCAIDLNWRRMNGKLRVASWGGTDGDQNDLFLSEKIVSMFAQVNEIQSIRDQEFNKVRDTLAKWLKVNQIPEWLCEQTQFLSRWQSQQRLAKLILFWRQNRFVGDENIFSILDGVAEKVQQHGKRDKSSWNGWRNWDKHLYEWERNLHQKAVRCRQAVYCDFAAFLTRRYQHIILEDINWKEIGEKADVGEKDNALVRIRKPIGAVGELASFIIERAACPEVVKAQNTTRRCPVCKTIGEGGSALYHECKNCGMVWDQDRKAWLNILLREERLDARLPKKTRDALRKASQLTKVA